jgi:phosphoribosylanthranilate isomerase
VIHVKVCGLNSPENVEQLKNLPIDYFGYVFHAPSKRYAGGEQFRDRGLFAVDGNRTGVFVDAGPRVIKAIAQHCGLSHIQLHGNEPPSSCQTLKDSGLQVIKSFRVDDDFDFEACTRYDSVCDYYLFDTRGQLPGGNGKKFNWEVVDRYRGPLPFFLSGGIVPGDEEKIAGIFHPFFYGIDLNSGFEDAPGIKNFAKVSGFLARLLSFGLISAVTDRYEKNEVQR